MFKGYSLDFGVLGFRVQGCALLFIVQGIRVFLKRILRPSTHVSNLFTHLHRLYI